MENKKAEKSQAELYREERKKRMAAAAKKNAKKSPQMQKAKHVAGKVIGIVIAVALVLGALYAVLNFFGVPQKVLTAAKVGDQRVSIAKYNLYYMEIYMGISQQSQQYDSTYGEGYGAMATGYDSTKTPMEQAYTLGTIEGFEGENPTWADYMRINALNYLQSYVAYADLAREAGLTLTEDEQKEIDDQIEQLRSTAESNDFSLNRYLVQMYGKGVNEKLLREVMEERQLASDYTQHKLQELSDAITDEQINTEYNDNLADYALVSVSAFTVTADTSSVADDATDEEKEAAKTEAMAKAKTLADGYAAKVTSPETLLEQAKLNNSSATQDSVTYTDVTPSTLTSYFGQAACDWVVSADRAVGNVTVVESDNGYTVIYLSALPHKDTVKPVDVRHILIAFPTDSSGKAEKLTEEEKLEYYDKAKSVYDQYLANPTEDNFATLASTNSEDPGSKDNGGLYEEINVDFSTDDAFNDWCFDASRKPGDTGIIETSFGYHIMYYVGNDHEETWKTTVKTALSNEAFNSFDTETLKGDTYKLTESSMMINWAASQLESLITKQYISYN